MAGSSRPGSRGELEALVREGVSHLVSLSPDAPPPDSPVEGLTVHYIGVEDFKAPTMDQFRQFIAICQAAEEAGEGVAVHCRMGHGRTGTMLAVYLVWSRGMEARAAVAEVRRARPGAVESLEQEEAVARLQEDLQDAIARFQEELGNRKKGG